MIYRNITHPAFEPGETPKVRTPEPARFAMGMLSRHAAVAEDIFLNVLRTDLEIMQSHGNLLQRIIDTLEASRMCRTPPPHPMATMAAEPSEPAGPAEKVPIK